MRKGGSVQSGGSADTSGGATLYGRVYCGDKPLSGVSVSDGVSVVRTDSDGVYNIITNKINGYVFVSIPSGYAMADATAVSPKFWKSVDSTKKDPERVDFKLVEENQDVFTMLLLGDTQIFNTNSVNLFKNTVIPELNSYVNSVATSLSSTEPVKALTMFREQAE